LPTREKHQAVTKAESLVLELMAMGPDLDSSSNFVTVATRGLMDVVGGLVQATCEPSTERFERAHAIVQLKRALKGHAFARGAIFGLLGSGVIEKEMSDRIDCDLESILDSIHALLAEAWDEGPNAE
jgi:hypothetical protein